MAQRASDSDAHEAVALVEPLHSDHRIVLEQIIRVLDVVEAEAHALEDVAERRRNGIEVDLQAELERLPGRQALADASELLTRDRFVQAELVTPVGLTAEGLGAEDGAALLEQLVEVGLDRVGRLDPAGRQGGLWRFGPPGSLAALPDQQNERQRRPWNASHGHLLPRPLRVI